tara:strand:+ start:161 stop:370 length:210 start_codon:yes stop_codon:yes gene_type:complete
MENNIPKTGDCIACSDGDVGIVLSTFDSEWDPGELMIEVAWTSGKTMTDLWNSQHYTNECSVFWILSTG